MNKFNVRAISVAVFWLTLVVQIPKFCAEVNGTVAPRTQATTSFRLGSCTKVYFNNLFFDALSLVESEAKRL